MKDKAITQLLLNGEIKDEEGHEARYISQSLSVICLANCANILLTRLRNIEYKNNRSVKMAIRDILVKDNWKALIKGNTCYTIGWSFITNTIQDEQDLETWPVSLLICSAIAHPWLVVATRV